MISNLIKGFLIILSAIFCYLAMFAIFGLIVAGIYYVVCLAFGWAFSWMIVFAISLVLLFLKAFFFKGNNE